VKYRAKDQYTPTHCQDKELVILRWSYRHWLGSLERREPVGRKDARAVVL